MTRLIDADALEPHEMYDGKEFVQIVYKDDIDEAPTVEQRQHGEWEDCGGVFCARCSVCKDVTYETVGNFCPNCGSDNRKRGDEK